jgi:cytochrome c-type biogenesis protein CcmE
MTRRKRRLVLISTALAALSLALGLVLLALRDNIVFFYGPSELAQKAPHAGQRLRIGGLVKQGSLVHEGDRTVRFAVTDTKQEVEVTYTGLLPDLFREGQADIPRMTMLLGLRLSVSTDCGNANSSTRGLPCMRARDIGTPSAGNADFVVIQTHLSLCF